MKKRKIFYLAITVLLVMVLLTACTRREAGEQEKYVFRYGMQFSDPNLHPSGLTNLVFIEEFHKRISPDRAEFRLFPGGQLGNSTDAILGGVLNRTAEFMDFNAGSYATYTTAFTPLETPFLFLSAQQVYDLLDGEAGRLMKEQSINDSGLRVLYYTDNGFRHLTNSSRPVNSPADMRGMKIRVMNNPVYIQLMEALGALPSPLSFSELYTALQQGVVDGQENPVVSIVEMKFYEIQDYITLTGHAYGISTTVMSEDYYQSLPADIRQAIDEAAAVAQVRSREIMKEIEGRELDYLRTRMQVTELSESQLRAFQDAARTMWPSVAGLSSQEYFDRIVGYIR